MNLKETAELLSKYWPLLLAVIIIIAPIIWWFASTYYAGRIDSLKEQNNLLRETRDFLERKLKSLQPMLDEPGPATSSKPNESPQKESRPPSYPAVQNPEALSKQDVKRLADFYELTKTWRVNPHLKFKDGDISYWFEQNLSEDELRREFESRRIILQRAENTGQTIKTQGDLSHQAQQIQSELIKMHLKK